MTIERSFKRPREDKTGRLSSPPLDTNMVEDDGNDLITISTVINEFLVERILVDNGSAIEVLM